MGTDRFVAKFNPPNQGVGARYSVQDGSVVLHNTAERHGVGAGGMSSTLSGTGTASTDVAQAMANSSAANDSANEYTSAAHRQ